MGTLRWKVNRLLSDELDYELKIRNVDPLAYPTVAEKRKKLRSTLASLGADPSLGSQFDFSALDLEEELGICRQRLEDLRLRVASLRDSYDANAQESAYSRVTHYLCRLERLKSRNDAGVLALLGDYEELFDELEEIEDTNSSSFVEELMRIRRSEGDRDILLSSTTLPQSDDGPAALERNLRSAIPSFVPTTSVTISTPWSTTLASNPTVTFSTPWTATTSATNTTMFGAQTNYNMGSSNVPPLNNPPLNIPPLNQSVSLPTANYTLDNPLTGLANMSLEPGEYSYISRGKSVPVCKWGLKFDG